MQILQMQSHVVRKVKSVKRDGLEVIILYGLELTRSIWTLPGVAAISLRYPKLAHLIIL